MKSVYLAELLSDIPKIPEEFNCEILSMELDSRLVKSGDLFIAYSGTQQDGRQFIPDAIQRGAVAVLSESLDSSSEVCWYAVGEREIPLVTLPHLSERVGEIASRFYGYPSQSLWVTGFTGTSGKSSCSHYLAQALNALGTPCGFIGTLGVGFLENLEKNSLTTPDPIRVHRYLAELYGRGAQAVAMEISSHALAQHRVRGIQLEVGVWTNLTQDHLDFHENLEAYAKTKATLFELPGLKRAVLNTDDPTCRHYAAFIAQKMPTVTYGLTTGLPDVPFVKGIIQRMDAKGIKARVISPWGEGYLQTKLLGEFTLSNLLAVLTVLVSKGVPFQEALAVLNQVEGVPGRFERFGGGTKQPLVIVDYAHKPDALKQVLMTLRAHCQQQLWTVFGCGGNRDRTKRPLMGQIAEHYSDRVIITDDNPRHEDPKQIVRDIQKGLLCPWATEIIHDREVAIGHALTCAQPGDMVLIAGKGHETTQQVEEVLLPFSDAQMVRHHLSRRKVIEGPSEEE